FWQKLNKNFPENLGSHYTLKISYSFYDIFSLYTAHLLEQNFYHPVILDNYSHTIGAAFSLANALAGSSEIFDLRPSIEWILEKQYYSVVGNLSINYKNFDVNLNYAYQFSDKRMQFFGHIAYHVGPLIFAFFDTVVYRPENHFLSNTWGIEVIYEL
ncbi:MAG: hypothetical protein AAF975_08610, partial [Spirochaetota bacterium]